MVVGDKTSRLSAKAKDAAVAAVIPLHTDLAKSWSSSERGAGRFHRIAGDRCSQT